MTFFNGRRERLDAFRAGDRAVLTEVFHFYADEVTLLLRHGFRLDAKQLVIAGARNVDREKELLQDVFVRAFAERARHAFNPLLPYRPYLLQIARNLLIDELRAKGPRLATDISQDELEQVESLAPNADDELEWRRLRDATTAFCRELPPQQHEFVRLRFEEGLSQADLAERLGVSRRQVRTWEAQVHDQLRAKLQAMGLAE